VSDESRADFMTLYRDVHARASRFARYLAGAEDAGEELLAESVAMALEKFRHLRNQERFGPWLFAIMRNRYRSAWRRYRLRKVEPLSVAGDVPASDTRMMSPSDEAWLAGMLAALPRAEREALMLHELEGFSVRETARIVRARVGAVKMRLVRARRRLAKLLRAETEREVKDDEA